MLFSKTSHSSRQTFQARKLINKNTENLQNYNNYIIVLPTIKLSTGIE